MAASRLFVSRVASAMIEDACAPTADHGSAGETSHPLPFVPVERASGQEAWRSMHDRGRTSPSQDAARISDGARRVKMYGRNLPVTCPCVPALIPLWKRPHATTVQHGPWRGGRVVECTALEMRHTGNRIGGSNPPLSASSNCPALSAVVYVKAVQEPSRWPNIRPIRLTSMPTYRGMDRNPWRPIQRLFMLASALPSRDHLAAIWLGRGLLSD
jgi:hypothetical protein